MRRVFQQLKAPSSALTATALISAALMLGRLSGFVRETLLANRLGTSASADASILLLTLPDFMVGLLLAGGFNAALVPALTRTEGAARVALLWRVALLALGLFLAIALLIAVFSTTVVRLFIPRLDPAAISGFDEAFALSLAALPIAALIGVSAAYLNTIGRFSIAGLGVLIFNGGICLFLVLPWVDPTHLPIFASVVVLATGLRLLFQLAAMPEALRRPALVATQLPAGLVRDFLIGTLGFSVIVGAAVVFRSLHALNGDGFMAAFNYAQKLFELPAALLIAPVVIVLLPSLSAIKADAGAEFTRTAKAGLMAALTLALIAAMAGGLFMPSIVDLIYQHGAVTPTQGAQIAQTARILVASLPLYALLQVAATALNAQGRPNQVMIYSLVGLIAGVLGYAALAALGWAEIAAAAGFGVFQAVAAGLCLRAVFGTCWPSRDATLALISLMLRLCLIAFPFVALVAFVPDIPLWLGLSALALCAAAGLAANLGQLRPLMQMRIASGKLPKVGGGDA